MEFPLCNFLRSLFYLMGTRGSFPWGKSPGREADHSPPSSAKVKEWVELYLHSPSTSPWHGAQFKKHRDNFTFIFIKQCIVFDVVIKYQNQIQCMCTKCVCL